jgi:protein-disulfide isomerase
MAGALALGGAPFAPFAPFSPAAAQSSDISSDTGPRGALADPESAFGGNDSGASWHAEVARTDRGHIIGNPEAGAHLIEFMSYTCGHCAAFAREGGPALDLALLAPGHLNVEIRPVIRNVIDLTVSLLVQCGEPSGFKDRHRMYLYAQDTWLGTARNAPQSQQAIWARGNSAARLSAARALDLDDMLAVRGMSMPEINACIADDAAALALIENGRADNDEFTVPGTPSFALDGVLLTDVHNWAALYPVLAERFRPGNEEN